MTKRTLKIKVLIRVAFYVIIIAGFNAGISSAQEVTNQNRGMLNISAIPPLEPTSVIQNKQVMGMPADGSSRNMTKEQTGVLMQTPVSNNNQETNKTSLETSNPESPEQGNVVFGYYSGPAAPNDGILLSGRDVLIDEGFETWEPEGWSFYQLGVQWLGWQQSNFMPHSGGFTASHGYYSGGVHNNWMVTPQLTIDQVYNLEFWDRLTDYNYYDYSGVFISTGSGDPTSGDFVEIYNADGATPLVWTEHVFDLTPYIGENIYIAFQYMGNNAHKWYVDDVKVIPLTYADGGIVAITNPPVGTTTVGGSLENVTITLKNFGTDIINEANIEWMVNGESQAPFLATDLNLEADQTTSIEIGQYNFSAYMDYEISVTCFIDGDQNVDNDNFSGTYMVDDMGNAGITKISPKGQMAAAIVQDVSVTIKNFGTNVLESVEVEWEINGVSQVPFQASNLGLSFGQTAKRTIGQFDFSTPDYYTIFAGTNLPIDYLPSNDTMSVILASAMLREGFEGPHDQFWPPDHWLSLNASPLTDWPYEGNYMGHILSGASEFGATDGWLATPLLDINAGDEINFQLSFDLMSGGGFSVNWMDGETGEVHFIQSVSVTPGDWFEQSVDISAAAGINRIVFKVHSDAYVESFLDMVKCTAPVYTYNNDLEALRFNQNWTPVLDEQSAITCRVRNYTAFPVEAGAYTVKLMEEPGVILSSVPGTAMNALATAELQFEYTFTDENQHNLYFEVEYTMDQNTGNNISNVVSVYPIPASSEFVDIGNAEFGTLNIPFDTFGTEGWGENDFTQMIYQFDEIGTMGYIYGFKFKYNLYALIYGQELPLTVWVGQTLNNDLSGGWEPYENLTLVFDSLVVTKNYEDEMFIPFQQPYLYTGGNLVIQTIQHDPSFPASWTSFFASETPGEIRTAKSPDWYEIDPENPPSFEFETQKLEQLPDITFVINPFEDLASVSGFVYDENAQPLENAVVEVLETAIKIYTDNQGSYTIPILPYGEWDFVATALGYEQNLQTITVDEENEMIDFTMVPKPFITLSGYVEGSEQSGTPLEGVKIRISGYNNYSGVTGSTGTFSLENVFGNADYEISISKFGYESFAQSFTASDQNIDFGTIILTQRVISVFDASASDDPEDMTAEIMWPDPLTGMEDTLRFDTGNESYGLANEPMENVWLGNLMQNDEVITITSVSIFFINNPQTPGQVTLDIFDANENLLVTSASFTTQQDSWLNIDFPNLTYDGDLYIMLHWKNNPTTTHMLGIDFTLGIDNLCYIGYPGESFQLLSEYLGTNSAIALIRANVLKYDDSKSGDSKGVMSYNLYRGQSDDLYNIGNWTLVNTSPVTDLEYMDQEWLNTEPNDYRYAVEAIYASGTADVTYTNIISVDIAAPANLDVVPNSSNATAMFSWDSPMHNVQSYKIYLDDMNTPVATGVGVPEFEFTDVPQGLHEAGVRAVYNTGQSDIETFVFDQIVGIDENQEDKITIYPNPASNFIMVNHAMQSEFKICDLTGRPVMQGKLYDANQRIDISGLSQGSYVLNISFENTSINKKLEIFR